MTGLETDNRESIDRKTSRSICDAVAERLQSLHPQLMDASPQLDRLIDELRQRESESRTGTPSQSSPEGGFF